MFESLVYFGVVFIITLIIVPSLIEQTKLWHKHP